VKKDRKGDPVVKKGPEWGSGAFRSQKNL